MFSQKRNQVILASLLLLVFLIVPNLAYAGIGAFVNSIVGWLGSLLLQFIGMIITLVLAVLTNVASFNDFIYAPAVVTGWVLVRDVCNMFFIVMLLIISIATVLGIDSYSYKNTLKKLIYMAVLINFSKTISGFLIDVSQVVMLTFVAAFQDMLAVGFIEAFKINNMLSQTTTIDPNSGEETASDNLTISLGIIFSVVIAFILLLVLIAMTVMLVVRIVTLWILIVLSPLAYLFSAIPGKFSAYSSTWWKKFSEQLVFGPALAFFLWLTLSVVAQSGNNFSDAKDYVSQTAGNGILSNTNYILQYMIGLAMLIIGMNTAKEMGGAAGQMGGKAFAGMKGLSQKGAKMLGSGASRLGEATTRGGLNLANKVGGGFAAGGTMQLAKTVLNDRKQMRKDKSAAKWTDRLDKMGFKDKSYQALGDMAQKWDDKGQRIKTTALRGGTSGVAAMAGTAALGGGALSIAGAFAAPVAAGYVATNAIFGKNSAFRAAVNKKNAARKNAEDKRKEVGNGVLKNSGLVFDKDNAIKPGAAGVMYGDEDFTKRDMPTQEKDWQREYTARVDDVKGAKNLSQAKDKQMTLNRFIEGAAWQMKTNPTKSTALKEAWDNTISKDSRYVADEKLRDIDDADDIKDEFGNGKLSSNTSVDVSKIKTSKSDYLKDKDIERANNTAEQLASGENIEGIVGTEVKNSAGIGGWKIEKLEADNVIISNGQGVTETMKKEDFVRENAPAMADNFYGKEYNKLSEVEKQDILSPAEYDKFAKQQPLSYDGVTMGSLKNDQRPENIIAAVSMDKLNERTGMNLQGVGAHLRGEEALVAARGMKGMISEQKEDLQTASTNKDLGIALRNFGITVPHGKDGKEVDLLQMREQAQELYNTPGSGEEKMKKVTDLEKKQVAYDKVQAKHDEHQQYEYMINQGMDLGAEGQARYEATTLSAEEQEILKSGSLTPEEKKVLDNDPRKNVIYQQLIGADNAVKTLSDEEYVANNGISLKNKVASGAVTGKDTTYHEFGHALIEKNDPTGQVQKDFWNSLTHDDQAKAKQHIEQTRGKANFAKMNEQDIAKEYFNDALVNETKPGGPATDQPRLPESMRKRIEVGTSTVPMAEKAKSFLERRAEKNDYKQEQKKASNYDAEQHEKEKAKYYDKVEQINKVRSEQQQTNVTSAKKVTDYNDNSRGASAIASALRTDKSINPNDLLGIQGLEKIKGILKNSGAVSNDLNLESVAQELQESIKAKSESAGGQLTGQDAFKDLLKQSSDYAKFAADEVKVNQLSNQDYDKEISSLSAKAAKDKTKLDSQAQMNKTFQSQQQTESTAAEEKKETRASTKSDTKGSTPEINIDLSGTEKGLEDIKNATKDLGKDTTGMGKDIADSIRRGSETTARSQNTRNFVDFMRDKKLNKKMDQINKNSQTDKTKDKK
ncbi:MAG: hypothetical protein COX77_02340 [Candidatus Komeilibacteria bacterium CG_4_10_14_0_2_um_filter_37_10]|uniref:Uncharacterized protein n=1 Tax=Candidatus Komeilibacteria bacterium CG_4_10_14_0_2_um_filter_37_10 TaxID=1974470 RepID=A0A2M7VEX2_9BACT|nr:MAG: hypothetical protein COX77_02340 [Candidatus Komeilibacteria bacterium CG_4_10_14_0_2_um_filter_37_10]